MNYRLFLKELLQELKKDERLSGDISFSVNTGINGVKSRRMIIRNHSEGISPCIHLDYYYDEFMKGRSAEEIAKSIVDLYCARPDFSETDVSLSWDRLHDHISFMLINYERNREMLKSMPHIRFLDFALIFRTDSGFLGIDGFIKISTALMSQLGVDTKALFTAAYKNTPTLLPISIFPMGKLFSDDMISECDLPEILVCTNQAKSYGASVILYDDFIKKAAESGYEDFYIIPSSVHELLLFRKESENMREDLEELVREVNRSDAVSASDYLSDRVYTAEEFSAAVDSIVKQNLL